MNYRPLLQYIISSISPKSISGTKESIVGACDKIQQTAISVNHPFQTFEDQCVYCYTGTHWKKLKILI